MELINFIKSYDEMMDKIKDIANIVLSGDKNRSWWVDDIDITRDYLLVILETTYNRETIKIPLNLFADENPEGAALALHRYRKDQKQKKEEQRKLEKTEKKEKEEKETYERLRIKYEK